MTCCSYPSIAWVRTCACAAPASTLSSGSASPRCPPALSFHLGRGNFSGLCGHALVLVLVASFMCTISWNGGADPRTIADVDGVHRLFRTVACQVHWPLRIVCNQGLRLRARSMCTRWRRHLPPRSSSCTRGCSMPTLLSEAFLHLTEKKI